MKLLDKFIKKLKTDLETETQRLEKLAVNEENGSEEEIKLIVALECYNKVLNQLNS